MIQKINKVISLDDPVFHFYVIINSMKVDLRDVFNFSEVVNECRALFNAVDKDGVAVVYKHNRPTYVILPYSDDYEIDDEEVKDWDGSPEELEEINRMNEELLRDLNLENNTV